MKIALLLSGLPRMWHPSLLTQLNMLAPNEVGVFFHFWDTIDTDEKNQLLDLLKPVAYAFEPQKDFSAFDTDPRIKPDNINIPSRITSQFYSWKRTGEIFAPHAAQYDFAVRSRADLQFVRSINYFFPHLKKNDLVMPWWDQNLLSDLLAIGDCDMVLYYMRIYDEVMNYAKDNPYNPELLLMRHLESSPVPPHIYAETDQKWFFVRRPHMENMSIDECMKENPGRNKWLNPEIVDAHKEYHMSQKGADAGEKFIDFFSGEHIRILAEEKQKNG